MEYDHNAFSQSAGISDNHLHISVRYCITSFRNYKEVGEPCLTLLYLPLGQLVTVKVLLQVQQMALRRRGCQGAGAAPQGGARKSRMTTK